MEKLIKNKKGFKDFSNKIDAQIINKIDDAYKFARNRLFQRNINILTFQIKTYLKKSFI